MMATGAHHEVEEVGVMTPATKPSNELGVGEVGYLISGIKEIGEAKVGDTVTDTSDPAREALPGYREPKPMVYAGLYPISGEDYPALRDALEKLQLNDAALMDLCQSRRGVLDGMHYLGEDRVELRYRLPLAEIIFDFFDQLKSRSRGYASLDYEPIGYQPAQLVKVDILLHGEPVDAFS